MLSRCGCVSEGVLRKRLDCGEIRFIFILYACESSSSIAACDLGSKFEDASGSAVRFGEGGSVKVECCSVLTLVEGVVEG